MSENDKTPSVKLPSARDISRTDFTPHGINRGKGSLKRPANKADQRKKRLINTGITVIVVAVLGGVAGGAYALTRPEKDFKVSGAFNAAPKVKFPEIAPFKKSTTKVVIPGSGDVLKKGDTAFLAFASYKWTGAKKSEPQGTYKDSSQGSPITGIKVGDSTGLKPLDNALNTVKVGERLLVTMTAKDLGEQATNVGLKATDSLVFVLDVLSSPKALTGAQTDVGDAKLPKITAPKTPDAAPGFEIPKGDAPKELVVKTLIQGTGKPVAKGQALIGNYEGHIWRDNKKFDSSWDRKAPTAFEIGTGKVVKGWDEALVGVKAGSRVMIVIPPDLGYGKEGNSQAGIKGTDTLVFVVDVLDSI
ncbi:FKBP-type peptidyl-prolyl cis-trans isomerase [Actinocorallia longicatena]|uniref:peptidylprolyl isomerase n=1 Tax=Actinocorallia longicatena TaxID=111803 RepID=A0ABP6QL43_9ACTN